MSAKGMDFYSKQALARAILTLDGVVNRRYVRWHEPDLASQSCRRQQRRTPDQDHIRVLTLDGMPLGRMISATWNPRMYRSPALNLFLSELSAHLESHPPEIPEIFTTGV